MFAYTVFLCVCFITSNVAADTNSASSMTSDTCYTTGFWTIWFDVDATPNPYPTLVQIANATCQSPLAVDFGTYQPKSANAGSDSASSAWSQLLDLLQRASQVLSGRDFAVRFCCVVSSSNNNKTTTTKTTTKKTTTRSSKTTTKVASNVTLRSLDGSVCGKQSISPSPGLARIFGGTDAIAHSWPWTVIFYQVTDCDSSTAASNVCYTVCGGTIISNSYILTAAHCINTTDPDSITIVAGMHEQSSTTEAFTRQVRGVSRVHIHPQYETTNYLNDIAILRLTIPLAYTTFVQPACLPLADPAADDQVIIVGWGTDQLGGESSDVLKQAYSTIVGDCSSLWPQVDDSTQICVANSDSGDSACQGDSGGPILYLNNKQYVVAGVASYGYTCRTAGDYTLPNVYTRVSDYKTWIQSIAS